MIEGLYEQVKLEFPLTGTVFENTVWRPKETDVRLLDTAKLADDEVGELFMVEVYNPNKQPVKALWFSVDDVDDATKPYIYLNGEWDTLMAPPLQLIVSRNVLTFGKPTSTDLLGGTTVKFTQKCLPRILAGTGGITQPLTVTLHIYVYKVDALPRIFGTLSAVATVIDSARDRTYTIHRPDLAGRPVTAELWQALPGGKTQALPKIYPLVRFAQNTNPVTTVRDYEFNARAGNVESIENNMWWEATDNEIIVVKGLGVRANDNSKYTALKIADKSYPKYGFYGKPDHNELQFGKIFPLKADSAGGEIPEFLAIPELRPARVIFAAQRNLVGELSESGGVVHRADAADVPAGGVSIAISGVRIQLTG